MSTAQSFECDMCYTKSLSQNYPPVNKNTTTQTY